MRLEEVRSRKGFLDSVDKTCHEAGRVGKIEVVASLIAEGVNMRLNVTAMDLGDHMQVTVTQPDISPEIGRALVDLLGAPATIVDQTTYIFLFKP
jgi:hypothetical protein